VDVTLVSGTAAGIRSDYLKLLVTQLQNQDPLDPMSNNEMTSQLSSMTQLERLESMDRTFQQVLLSARVSEAVGMIGKEVGFYEKGKLGITEGRVESVHTVGGEVMLKVGNEKGVWLDDVRTIKN
jgi:flagellar basal-body rod modification protein FlgD